MTLSVKLQHSIDNHSTASFKLKLETSFPSGQISALFGPSGAGKTTLLRCISGLEKFPQCEIKNHQTIWQNQTSFIRSHQRQVGFVFQNSRLFPHLSVDENLNYGISRAQKKDQQSLIDKPSACNWFSIESLLERHPHQLSAGETQRVALARAILNNPQWLLLDEPIANLDELSKSIILKRLKNINEQYGLSMIFVSHDLEDAAQIASHLTLIDRGEITTSGKIEEVLNNLDSGISAQEMGSIVEGQVQHHDTENGLSSIQFPGGELNLQQISCATGTRIKVRIPARDVSINLEHAQHSSVLNIMSAEVVEIKQHCPANALIKLKVGDQFILSNITKKSLHRLALVPNKKVFAQIKSVSLVSHPNLYQSAL
ncbi:MAG: molybdenum ABC transporter ATP-binding protein [Moraxellaceae bacterium]|nr:MAG: molybdenum ABC transporter ATP-binding protein [Moraxellaceae bacterium]